MPSNKLKYLSYAEAWRRIAAGNKQGFYFEAVALCESILSDRLLSYLNAKSPNSKFDCRTRFAKLISEWRKTAPAASLQFGEEDLGEAVDAWRNARNDVIHGLTKSPPGTPTSELAPFLERAQETAKRGALLARAVSNWHRSQATKAGKRKPAKSSPKPKATDRGRKNSTAKRKARR